jgi:hypothetical protein
MEEGWRSLDQHLSYKMMSCEDMEWGAGFVWAGTTSQQWVRAEIDGYVRYANGYGNV